MQRNWTFAMKQPVLSEKNLLKHGISKQPVSPVNQPIDQIHHKVARGFLSAVRTGIDKEPSPFKWPGAISSHDA